MSKIIMKPYAMYKHKLNLDSIETIDDCKNVLKLLCELTMPVLQEGTELNGFEEYKKYFSK